MKLRQFFLLLFIVLLARGPFAAGQPAPQSIILASTASVENSGLLAHKRRLSPAATRAAPTRSNTAYGVWRGSIPPKLVTDRGTATSAAAWVRH